MTAPALAPAASDPAPAPDAAAGERRGPRVPTRLERRLPWLVAAAVALVVLAVVGPWPVGVFFDDGVYLILAKAIATGQGYRYLQLPGHPAATHYPPGYPLFLAALWRLWPTFPGNVVLFKSANALLLAAAAGGAVAFARARFRLTSTVAAAVALLGTLSIPLLSFGTVLFSEPLGLALLFPTLVLAEREVAEGRDDRLTSVAMLALLCDALFLVRTLMIVLPAAIGLLLLRRRRWRGAALFALLSAAAVLPWQLWVGAHATELPLEIRGHYGPYVAWVLDAWRRKGVPFILGTVRENLARTWTATHVLLTVPALRALGPVLATIAGLGFLAGARVLRRAAPVTLLFLAGYLGIVFLWPFAPYRFLWGIWPLLCLVVAAGAAEAWRAAREPGASRAAAVSLRVLAAGCVTAAIGHASYNARGFARGWWDEAQREEAETALPGVNWVAAHVPPDRLVATEYGPLLWLYTGRQAVPPSRFSPDEYLGANESRATASALAIVREFPLYAYIVSAAGTAGGQPATDLARRRPPALRLVDTLPGGGAVYLPVQP